MKVNDMVSGLRKASEAIKSGTHKGSTTLMPKWLDTVATWLRERLPDSVREICRAVGGEVATIPRSTVMLLAEEMFVRDLLSKEDVVYLNSTYGTDLFNPEALQKIMPFLQSLEWKKSTPAWDRRRNRLRRGLGALPMGLHAWGSGGPRTTPLKGSKAREQQLSGHGPGSWRKVGISYRKGFDEQQKGADKMIRRLRPIGERVLVRRHEAPDRIGSVIVPGTVRARKTIYGEVLDTGSRVEAVEVGQQIMFSKTTGIDCTLDGEKYLLLWEEDIIGVLD